MQDHIIAQISQEKIMTLNMDVLFHPSLPSNVVNDSITSSVFALEEVFFAEQATEKRVDSI